MNRGRYILLSLFVICFFPSCSKTWKKIPPKDMEKILIDMSLTESFFQNNYTPDSIRIRGYSEICRKHGFSMSDWDSSVALYSGKYIETYEKIYKNALDSIVRLQSILQSQKKYKDSIVHYQRNIFDGNIDSVNLLVGKSVVYHRGNAVSFSLRFNPPYSDKYSIELLIYIGRIGSIIDSSKTQIRITMAYSDSTDSIVSIPIRRTGINALRVNVPKGKALTNINGAVYLGGKSVYNLSRIYTVFFQRLPRTDEIKSYSDSTDVHSSVDSLEQLLSSKDIDQISE